MFHSVDSIGNFVKRFVVFFLMVISSNSYAQPFLTLTTPDITSHYFHTADYQGLGDRVLKEALSRIGYGLKVVVLPTERSLLMANTGHVDGELLRTRSIEHKYPELIRVKEALVDFEFVVFANRSAPSIDQNSGWDALKGKSVGVVIGMKIIEQSIPEGADVTRVRNAAQLFGLVRNKRIQYAVFTRDLGESFIHDNAITGISASETVLSYVPAYTYLNKKHAQLVPKIEHSLKKMKQDGTLQKILQQHKRSRLFER